MWSDSANGSASFNSKAADVGICGTAEVVGILGAEGVAGRIRIIRVRAQLAVIVPLLVIQPRDICPAVVPMYEQCMNTRHDPIVPYWFIWFLSAIEPYKPKKPDEQE